jgi:hypothetical protein
MRGDIGKVRYTSTPYDTSLIIYIYFDPAGMVKLFHSGLLPVMNSERYPPLPQQLKDEQVGQTRSCTKAART